MVSRRNFFTILILMLIMIFMFMFSSVIKQEFNEYDVNSYADRIPDAEELKNAFDRMTAENLDPNAEPQTENYVAGNGNGAVFFLGEDAKNDVAEVVKAFSIYTKRRFRSLKTLDGFEKLRRTEWPEILVVDGESIDWKKEAERLEKLVDRGICVIFATLPDCGTLENNDCLRSITGIDLVYQEEVEAYGIHLFPGFLMGRETIYEPEPGLDERVDLNLEMPWFILGEGTKTYIMATIITDQKIDNELLPAVAWRCGRRRGRVFCFNGDYIKSKAGIGFLTACVAEKDSYDIYPVINAQNMVLANYGGFADENHEVFEANYDQTQIDVFRDLVWPTIIALNEHTGARISMMTAPQLDYEDDQNPVAGQLVYYLRLLKESKGEAGISAEQISDVPIETKLARDLVYWQSEAMNYKVQSAYLTGMEEYDAVKNAMQDLKTVALKEKAGMPVDYLDEDVTAQAATSMGVTHTFSEDIATKALETSLGYSSIVVDLARVSFPKEEYWEKLSRKITSNLNTYWRDFSAFDQTTLSESDVRIRRFFALNYSDRRDGNEITLHVDQFDTEAFFVLKLNRGYVDEVQGAEITSLKNGFYLLKITEPDVVIRTAEDHVRIY